MNHQTEVDYIKRILKGETNLFSYFISSYNKSVYILIYKIIHSKEDAEELTQDVFLKIFRKLDTYRGDCNFSTWIYRIAFNTAISKFRKQKIIFPAIDDNIINNVADKDVDALFEKMENEDLIEKMEFCIEKLNPEDKTLLTLFYMENKSVQELSEIFEITTDNVKVKLHRIRKKLYVMIKDNVTYNQ